MIGILDFSFDNSYPDSVITKVQLMDNRGDVFNDVLNFVYIELPKFRKNKENLGRFYKFNLPLASSQNLFKAIANVILLSQK